LSVGLVVEAEAAGVLVYSEVLEGGHLEGAGQDPLLLITQYPHLTPVICGYLDEGVVGSGMGIFLMGGHWPKILPQTSEGAAKCVYCVGIVYVYGVLVSLLM
jgi:hypothetical protein